MIEDGSKDCVWNKNNDIFAETEKNVGDTSWERISGMMAFELVNL